MNIVRNIAIINIFTLLSNQIFCQVLLAANHRFREIGVKKPGKPTNDFHLCLISCSKQPYCKAFIVNEATGSCELYSTTEINKSSPDERAVIVIEAEYIYDPVVLTGKISSCSASSQQYSVLGCQYAYDGTSLPGYYHEWASYIQGVGAWMSVILDKFYVITKVRILQRCWKGEQVKTMRLMFSDSSSMQVNFGQYGTSSNVDCSGVDWETLKVTPTSTNSINFTSIEVYTSYNNGIREIELWGY